MNTASEEEQPSTASPTPSTAQLMVLLAAISVFMGAAAGALGATPAADIPLSLAESWAGMRLGALAGAALGILAAAWLAGMTRPRWKRWGMGLVPLAAAALGLILAGQHRADALDRSALAFGALGGLAAIHGLAPLLLQSRSRWRRWWSLPAIGIAIALAVWDPQFLRSVYAPFDFLLIGSAAGLIIVVISSFATTTPRTLLAAISGCSLAGAAALIPADSIARSEVVLRSPRLALVERVLEEFGLPAPSDAVPEVDAADPSSLELPPEVFRAAQKSWLERRGPEAPRLNVLWVTLDTVRADVTGLHGGTATPEIDRFSRTAFGFANAWSQGPGTLLSMESFATGLMPSASGLARAWRSNTLKDAEVPTLASTLSKAGYRTHYLTNLSDEQLGQITFTRLPRGFEEVSPREGGRIDAMRTAARCKDWLQQESPSPFFMWLHLFDAHHPYEARGDTPANADPRALWESEVRYADQAFGQVLRALDQAQLAQDTIVLVHADHGEAFGEHGRWYHASSYRDVQIRVPLAMRVPGLDPAVIEAPVGNVDLMPTLLSLLGIPPEIPLHGHDLLPTLLDPTLPWPRFAYADSLVLNDDSRFPGDRVRMITDGRYKLLRLLSDRSVALFDLQSDPGEQRNLAHREVAIRERLDSWLGALDRGRLALGAAPNSATIGPDPLQRLRSGSNVQRLAEVARLVSENREAALRAIEGRLSELEPGTAHAILVASHQYLAPTTSEPPPLPAINSSSSALDFRLRLAPLLDPARRAEKTVGAQPLPAPFEEHLLRLQRASRGEVPAVRELLELGANDDFQWAILATLLTRSGDETASALLQGLLRGSLPEGLMLRGFEALAEAQPQSFVDLIFERWPAPVPVWHPRTIGRLARIAQPLPTDLREQAALALLPMLGPEAGLRAFQLDVARAAELRAIGLDLAAARKEASPPRHRQLIALAAERARRAGLQIPALAHERRLGPRQTQSPSLSLQAAFPQGTGFVQARLSCADELGVLTGRGANSALVVRWMQDDLPLFQVGIPLPRTRLDAAHPIDLYCHWPPEVATATHLEASLGPSKVAISEPPREAPPRNLGLRGPALARETRTAALPNWILPEGLGFETMDGGHCRLELPISAQVAGRHESALRLSTWGPDADRRLAQVRIEEGKGLDLRLEEGELRVRWTAAGAETRRLRLLLPAESALWLLRSVQSKRLRE